MKKIVTVGASIIITTILALTITGLPALALGEGGFAEGVEAARGNGVPTNLWNGDSSLVRRVINFMLIGIAVISVVMLIFGGFRYVISGGRKESVTAAKNTILYAVIGLLIALFAYAIIKFVINFAVSGGSTDV
jgi:hypothetical protein cdiviTM7_00647